MSKLNATFIPSSTINNHSLIVESLAVQDIDQLESGWTALREHHRAQTNHFNDYYEQATFASRKAGWLSRDNLGLFVARQSDQTSQDIIGFIIASKHQGVGEIESLYVSTQTRDSGVGRSLMRVAMTWLNDLSASPIRLLVGDGNEDVMAFYAKCGFVMRATQMEWQG